MASDDTFTAEVPQKVETTSEFDGWSEAQSGTDSDRVLAAISKIESDGVVTSAKSLGDGLFEKKWKSGLRVYFAVIGTKEGSSLLLLGSGKGKEQNKTIAVCRQILSKYDVFKGDIRKKD